MDPDQVKAAIDALKNGDAQAALAILEALIVAAAGGGGNSMPPGAEDPLAADAEPPPAKLEALKALRLLTGRAGLGEAVEELKLWKSDREKEASNAAALELSSRQELIGELVKLGYEDPATAWEGDAKDRKPAKHLAVLSLSDLRTRVASFRGRPRVAGATPPASKSGGEVKTYSAAHIDGAKKLGITPEEFETRKQKSVRRV
jgi:hypothetical protein